MNTNNRLLYLDNLKVCLTLLVIFHHAGQAYGDGGDWGAFGKFMFIGIITTICSFVLTWLVRLLPGAKKVL